jgi:hypothetical protein
MNDDMKRTTLIVAAVSEIGEEDARKLLLAGYDPAFVMWRRNNTLCSSGEALKNLEIDAEEKRSLDHGFCPRCRRQNGHAPDCSLWRILSQAKEGKR